MLLSNRNSSLAPAEEAYAHALSLFHHGFLSGEHIELRALDCSTTPAKPGPRAFFRSVNDLIPWVMKLREDRDIFVGVAYRRCLESLNINNCPHSKRGLEHISRIPAVWADLDVATDDEPNKPHTSVGAILTMLDELPQRPDLVIASGAGVHAYWPLSFPSADLDHVVSINRAIRDRVGGDNAVDAARILRLAGTLNFKHGAPLPVRLLRWPS